MAMVHFTSIQKESSVGGQSTLDIMFSLPKLAYVQTTIGNGENVVLEKKWGGGLF